MSRHYTQQGLSLVEVMVAMTIGLILMAGVVQVFISSKSSSRLNASIGQLQEDGRFALNFLNRDIRMAGYAGCTRYGPITNTLNNPTNLAYDFAVGIFGFNDVSATTPAALAAIGATPKASTDAIIIRREADNPVRVVQNNNSAQVFLENTGVETGACSDGTDRISGICQTDILMISDCTKSRVFQAGNITSTGSGTGLALNLTHPASGTPGNAISSWGGASAPTSERFDTSAYIVKIVSYAYYIKNNNLGIPSLYRKDGMSPEVELAQGIDDMQILYGVDNTPTDTNQSADVYQTANAVTNTNWANVVSVRLNLLVRTVENNVAGGAQTYRFNGGNVTVSSSTDRYIRKEFANQVALRNRLR